MRIKRLRNNKVLTEKKKKICILSLTVFFVRYL